MISTLIGLYVVRAHAWKPFKELGHQEYVFRGLLHYSVLPVHAQMVFKFPGCLAVPKVIIKFLLASL
jgi:hypothetical protein